jgi:hypothetical protein
MIMVIFTYKYGMSVRKTKKGAFKEIKKFYMVKDSRLFAIAVLALLFAVVVFAMSSGYHDNVYAPAVLFGRNASTSQLVIYHQVLVGAKGSNGNITVLNTAGTNYLFILGKPASNSNGSTYAIANVTYAPLPYVSLPSYTPATIVHSYLLKNGVSIAAQQAYSDNTLFDLDYFSLPYNINGKWLMVNYVVFQKINSTSSQGCGRVNSASIGNVDYIQSEIYNLLNSQQLSKTSGLICNAYLVASSR